jgi:ElaB/YqjD/DUF883 family membrane-anchored ribosome-binding protein
MDPQPDLIRQQIDETRSALTEKLETLENKVLGSVENARATFDDTLANVRATVHQTVASVKRTFDLEYQVQQHPWAMVGGSVAAGFMVGLLLKREPRSRGPALSRNGFHEGGPVSVSPLPAAPAVQAPEKPRFLKGLGTRFEEELEQVKEMAIGAAMGLLRDAIKKSLPQLAPQIDRVMNSATSKMGGEPIPQPFLAESPRFVP